MVISQRGTSFTPANGDYTLDRWQGLAAQSSKYTVAQSSTAPAGFINSLLVTSSSAYSVGASDYFDIVQYVEGLNISDLAWGTAQAKTVCLSFQVYSSLTGTFGGSVQNNGQTRSYPFSYTISSANTWTTISVTIAGDTSGTWLTTNGRGIQLNFSLGTGSTFSGTAGAWATANYLGTTGTTSVVGVSGATWYATAIQLEVGTQATSFEYRQRGTELALCQRYFEMSFPQGTAPANGVANGVRTTSSVINTSNAYANSIMYVVQKRATPTVTTYNTDNGSSSGQAAYFVAGAWNNGNTTSTFGSMTNLGYNFGGTFTLLGAYYTDLHWIASAEL
jgi:hypothetical protein